MNIKELKPGTRFSLGTETIYTASRVSTSGGTTTVDYYIGTDVPVNRFYFSKPSLTTVKVVR